MFHSLDIIVSPDATVLQLRQAANSVIMNYLSRSADAEPCVKISWKKFWRRHTLVAYDVRMNEASTSIREYNIRTGTVLRLDRAWR